MSLEANWLYKTQYKQKVTHFYLESFKKVEFRTHLILFVVIHSSHRAWAAVIVFAPCQI